MNKRRLVNRWLISFGLLMSGCVDPYQPSITQAVNILIVDGTLTNLPEPQGIRLSRSQSVSGQPGGLPLNGARVEVVVDSLQAFALTEQKNGYYQLPAEFQGQVGHRYQLRFQLADGSRYESTSQQMLPVPAIEQIYGQFNPSSLSQQQLKNFPAAHDLFIDFTDPADQPNYYQWQWMLWEQQDWCHTCHRALYQIYDADSNLIEDCVSYQTSNTPPDFTYDYECRTKCWEILYSKELNIFDDQHSNGGRILRRRVAQIPFYQHRGCLVELRQASLTPDAYRYFRRLVDQTQRTGTLADTPPAAPIGNVTNLINSHEAVVGYFSASAISRARYWLDRSDTEGVPVGLFQALNGREAIPEVGVPPTRYRPPLAVCVPSDSRTPIKPAGWKE